RTSTTRNSRPVPDSPLGPRSWRPSRAGYFFHGCFAMHTQQFQQRFAHKVAVITGAAQGIGRRVAERMAAEGGRLVLVDRSELVHELADELAGVAEVLTLTADLEQAGDCQRVMAAAVERFGRLDILVNNVGGTIWAK